MIPDRKIEQLIEWLENKIASCDKHIEECCNDHYSDAYSRAMARDTLQSRRDGYFEVLMRLKDMNVTSEDVNDMKER